MVVAAALNIALNVFLIPRYQSVGAAWATLFAEIFLCAGMWLAARRTVKRALDQHAADVLAAEV
jgi:O-antigen/teichoic acid export membrane protein